MAKILDGKIVREEMKKGLKERVRGLGFAHVPMLAIVQVGDRDDSNRYIRNKQKFGEEIGVAVIHKKFEENIKEEELISEIEKLNKDEKINGIIVQLPLPEGLDAKKIIESIDKRKDADGLRDVEGGGEVLITPATARAVMSLLDFYKIEVEGKRVAVIGRSRLAGAPIAEALKERGAKVEVCHKGTENTAEVCRKADILVVAAGQAGLVTKDFVNSNQIVIDVGINKTSLPASLLEAGEGGTQTKPSLLVGDVAFGEVEPIVAAISPVPGGVGPLTVACLFQNLLDLCYNRSN